MDASNPLNGETSPAPKSLMRLKQLAAILVLLLVSPLAFAGEVTFMHQIQRVGGIVFPGSDTQKFLVATGYGALSVEPNGRVTQLSNKAGFLTELMAPPSSPNILFSSGYRSKTKKLGVIRSDDGGVSWSRISNGAHGPVAFHSMAISPINPATMYGAETDVQVSHDHGKTWTSRGEPPAQLFDIAASAKEPKTLNAATRTGLYRSADEGASWNLAHPGKHPAPMVHVTPDGKIYAFLYGLGLVVGDEPGSAWQLVSDKFAGRALIDLAIDPADPQRMLAVADTGAMMQSRDSGRNWHSFEGQLDQTPARIKAGRELYNENCQACHGSKGIGEKPDDPGATDENGLPLAPALDDSAHGWHHGDAQLRATILNGSPRNERMIPWKDQGLSDDDARNLVAYIKSLWNFRSQACQGSRHMRCMH